MGGIADADLTEQGGVRTTYKETWNWRLGRDRTLLNTSVPGRDFTPLGPDLRWQKHPCLAKTIVRRPQAAFKTWGRSESPLHCVSTALSGTRPPEPGATGVSPAPLQAASGPAASCAGSAVRSLTSVSCPGLPSASCSTSRLLVLCSVMSSVLRPHDLYEAHQAPLSVGFPRQGCWSGLPFPSAGDLPNPRKSGLLSLLPWRGHSLSLVPPVGAGC